MGGPRLRPIGSFALIAAALLMTTGCDADPAAPAQLGACDLVLDITGNPGPEWVRRTLDDGFDSLRENTCRDLVVTANLVTDYSKANTCTEPIINTNPGNTGNDSKNDRLRNEAWLGIVKRDGDVVQPGVKQELDRLINCGLYGPEGDSEVKFEGSDVFSALQASAETLEGIPMPRKIIVLSDMRNTMEPLKVPSKGEVTDQVAALEADDVIPDLSGAEVIIVGPGTNNDLSPSRQAKLVKFWESYFDSANAGSVSFRQTLG